MALAKSKRQGVGTGGKGVGTGGKDVSTGGKDAGTDGENVGTGGKDVGTDGKDVGTDGENVGTGHGPYGVRACRAQTPPPASSPPRRGLGAKICAQRAQPLHC